MMHGEKELETLVIEYNRLIQAVNNTAESLRPGFGESEADMILWNRTREITDDMTGLYEEIRAWTEVIG